MPFTETLINGQKVQHLASATVEIWQVNMPGTGNESLGDLRR